MEKVTDKERALQAEVDRLQAEVIRRGDLISYDCARATEYRKEADQLRARLEQAERHVRRYHWDAVYSILTGSTPNEAAREQLAVGAPAPQPPADATAMRTATERDMLEAGPSPKRMGELIDADLRRSAAAPHVTGDGDALCKECENRHETAQEISDHWIDRWNGGEGSGRGAVEGASSEAYAAGIARGRELGARDENVACEKIATEEMCGSKRTTSERLTGQRIVVPPITGSGGK